MNRQQRRRAHRAKNHAATTTPTVDSSACKHPRVGHPTFDEAAARGLSDAEIRRRWPRFEGPCPDCQAHMICYASIEHYILGDW